MHVCMCAAVREGKVVVVIMVVGGDVSVSGDSGHQCHCLVIIPLIPLIAHVKLEYQVSGTHVHAMSL